MALRRRLRIPDEMVPDLAALVNLDVSELAAFEAALNKTAPSLYRSNFAASVAGAVGSDDVDAEGITQALLFLYYARDVSGRSVTEFSEDLCDAMKAYEFDDDDDLDLTPLNDDWDGFRAIIERLLQYESAGVTAKAIGVVTEQAHSYCGHDSRVISDIRPVYYGENTGEVKAAVIVHTLKIAYHTADEVETFYVALDGRDIKNLRGLLDRAEEKEASLRAILDREHIPFLDVED